jgi:hypothetical protein
VNDDGGNAIGDNAIGDNGDGKGCVGAGVMSDEEAKKKGAASPMQGDPAINVYGGSNAATLEVREAVGDFLSGKGPTELEYSREDPFTESFQQSAGMDAITAGIRRNCSQAPGKVPVGTWEAFRKHVNRRNIGRSRLPHTPGPDGLPSTPRMYAAAVVST